MRLVKIKLSRTSLGTVPHAPKSLMTFKLVDDQLKSDHLIKAAEQYSLLYVLLIMMYPDGCRLASLWIKLSSVAVKLPLGSSKRK